VARRTPSADFDKEAWLEQKRAKLRSAQEMLERGVESFTDSEQFRAFLTFHAQHCRTYSFGNTMLIYAQRPDASLVMGFKKWQEHGRYVKKGEHGIMILAPSRYKKTGAGALTTEEGGDAEEEYALRFVPVSVFDVTQTEGDPVPEIIHELRGTSDEIQELRHVITRVLGSDGYEVGEEHLVGRHYGYVSKETGRVVTREGVDDLQALKTLLHEKAHVAMHVGIPVDEIPREQRELEAESVAFVVATYYGLDTSEYSFAYVSNWTRNDTSLIKAAADRIHHAASSIIDAMEQARETRTKVLSEPPNAH
jgi:antirestriction protein ArdC